MEETREESGVTLVTRWANMRMFRGDSPDKVSPGEFDAAVPGAREDRAPTLAAPQQRVQSRSPDALSSDIVADRAMDRYATGEQTAFVEVYHLLAPRLFAFLLRTTRSRWDAEDLLQQTMMKMHAARGRFICGAGVVPWAFAIARRLMIDRARRSKVRGIVADQGDPGEVLARLAALDLAADEVVHSKLLAKIIQRELDRLSPANRLAFELVKQDGLTHAEAAKVLGTTVMAVKLRTHRSCAALRAALQKTLNGGDG